jgi:hypothetical protein
MLAASEVWQSGRALNGARTLEISRGVCHRVIYANKVARNGLPCTYFVAYIEPGKHSFASEDEPGRRIQACRDGWAMAAAGY